MNHKEKPISISVCVWLVTRRARLDWTVETQVLYPLSNGLPTEGGDMYKSNRQWREIIG